MYYDKRCDFLADSVISSIAKIVTNLELSEPVLGQFNILLALTHLFKCPFVISLKFQFLGTHFYLLTIQNGI